MRAFRDEPGGFFLLRIFVQSYAIGTVAGAILLQIMIAIISPGDGGTLAALAYPTFIIFIPLVGLFALGPFLVGGLVGWQFRHFTLTKPITVFVASFVFGGLMGLVTSRLFGLAVLPGGVLSGPIVGASFGVVWFLVLRFSLERRSHA